MTELFRFWRTLPRAALGLVFVLQVALVVVGPVSGTDFASLFRKVKDILGEATTGVVLTLCLIAAASLGAEIERSILLPARFIAGRILKMLAGNSGAPIRSALRILGQSPVELAITVFKRHRNYFYDYYLGWSLATAETAELYDVIKRDWPSHFQLIENTLTAIGKELEELWRVAFFTSVTQEQALSDYMEATMEAVHAAWLTLLLMPVLMWRFGADCRTQIITLTIVAIAALALLPMYFRRKKTFAVYVVYCHATAFQFGELAENADREAT